MNDGSIKKLHANFLRKHYQRTANIGIIFDTDKEFEEVQIIPNKQDSMEQEPIEERFQKLEFPDAEENINCHNLDEDEVVQTVTNS